MTCPVSNDIADYCNEPEGDYCPMCDGDMNQDDECPSVLICSSCGYNNKDEEQ